MHTYQSGNTSGQLNQIENVVHQLIQQTQQASMQYQQLLKQEQENAAMLQQISQREQQAAHIIQTALQGHQTAIQQLNQITNFCNQISHTTLSQTASYMPGPQTQPNQSSYYQQ